MNTRTRYSRLGARHGFAVAILAALLSMAPAGHARELRVNAPVVNVESLTGGATQVEECPAKPAGPNDLMAQLRWDLGYACTTHLVESDTVTGYRVFYEWDNRVYSRVMSNYPGSTIALRIRLD